MPYTKRTALEKTLAIWTWLSENKGGKIDAYKALGFPYTKTIADIDSIDGTIDVYVDENACPCCQYSTEQADEGNIPYETSCNVCPVWNAENNCMKGAYNKWYGYPEEAKLVLAEILAAKERLDAEEAEEHNRNQEG